MFENVDLRYLAILTLGEPVAEYENRNTYCCPFHDDTHPSAVAFKNRFYCSACGVNLNKYDFVMQVTRSKTKNEMLMNLKEILNLQ
ncbi:CHC2 zinc finger domain-containing protein [uncultured Methanobrevibacter sp.]|uniref:CHC2 zinc finger domain-containing protein n=1 Tax=uncultured Methanobrevibacter sp. TaxID=253161 RepID=UPI0025CDA48A|nr:CHC2 zinc finger domain-containing protein [uncultured Methanobrevibacter sp.]